MRSVEREFSHKLRVGKARLWKAAPKRKPAAEFGPKVSQAPVINGG